MKSGLRKDAFLKAFGLVEDGSFAGKRRRVRINFVGTAAAERRSRILFFQNYVAPAKKSFAIELSLVYDDGSITLIQIHCVTCATKININKRYLDTTNRALSFDNESEDEVYGEQEIDEDYISLDEDKDVITDDIHDIGQRSRWAEMLPNTKAKACRSMTAKAPMLEHALWCQGKGDKEVCPQRPKMFPLEMEPSMIIRGTLEGEQAYPNDAWMKANNSGYRTFKLSEQYDQHQLKAYVSKPRRLRAKTAVA
jgi:hypothetical protein